MKIFDVFTFYNELDLLELRMEILGDVVDYFVINESNITFTGKEKPLLKPFTVLLKSIGKVFRTTGA